VVTEEHSRLVAERCELDLLRERIRDEPIVVIGGEHTTDDEGGTLRQLDPGLKGLAGERRLFRVAAP
jgi:hypothetical protein